LGEIDIGDKSDEVNVIRTSPKMKKSRKTRRKFLQILGEFLDNSGFLTPINEKYS
jgi:hypothetical protein